jgi:hypothetical protein
MRSVPIILLSCMIFSLLAISGESEQPGNSTPIYLGRVSGHEPVQIGGSIPAFAELRGARWFPMWPYNDSWVQKDRFIPTSDPLGMGEYHVPSIVEFLNPNWLPTEFDYSYYVPALGEFANASWKPPQANYSLHVPALREFLSEEWQPQRPNPADYPPLDDRISPQLIGKARNRCHREKSKSGRVLLYDGKFA